MNRTQKTLLVTAAITGLVAGSVAKARMTDNNQGANLAGKQMSSHSVDRLGCNGCSGKGGCNTTKTNSTPKNY